MVGKTARVKEEVVVNKAATDRVETVHDKVRREDGAQTSRMMPVGKGPRSLGT